MDNTQPSLKWFDNEDGFFIVGTSNVNEANTYLDRLIDKLLRNDEHLEEYKSYNRDNPELMYIRPDWEEVDVEYADLRFIYDESSENFSRANASTGVPTFFYPN